LFGFHGVLHEKPLSCIRLLFPFNRLASTILSLSCLFSLLFPRRIQRRFRPLDYRQLPPPPPLCRLLLFGITFPSRRIFRLKGIVIDPSGRSSPRFSWRPGLFFPVPKETVGIPLISFPQFWFPLCLPFAHRETLFFFRHDFLPFPLAYNLFSGLSSATQITGSGSVPFLSLVALVLGRREENLDKGVPLVPPFPLRGLFFFFSVSLPMCNTPAA